MNLLISACLLGYCCRFDGSNNGPMEDLILLKRKYHLIPICPEQLGGLTTPRLPAERLGDRVVNSEGADITEQYDRGAKESLRLARLFGCKYAILKSRSPSCGVGEIYDGTFTHTVVQRSGTTAQLLQENGITVLDETQVAQLLEDI